MTTIAYKDGVMAADGHCVNGWVVVSINQVKMHRLPDGSICGGSGVVAHLARYIESLIAGTPDRAALTNGTEHSDVLLVRPSGLLEYHHRDGVDLLPDLKFHAIGSGWMTAIGAMEMGGASAKKAVEIARKRDMGTAGRIRTMQLPQGKRRKSKG